MKNIKKLLTLSLIIVFTGLAQQESSFLWNTSREKLKELYRRDPAAFEKTFGDLEQSNDFALFGQEPQLFLEELYEEITGKPYASNLAKTVSALERASGKPLSQLIGEHLALLSPEDLDRIDTVLEQYAQSGLLGEPSGPTVKTLRNSLSETPLHRAIENNNRSLIAQLIASGADVNARGGEDMNTPLHTAVGEDDAETIKLLIKAGADSNAKDFADGNTPLHDAANQNHIKSVEALLKAQADPNARDNSNRTPLHDAASRGNTEIVDMLLYVGADPSLQTSYGNTALDLAREQNHTDIVNLLLKSPKKPLDLLAKELNSVQEKKQTKKATWQLDAQSGNALYTDAKGRKQTVLAPQLATLVASPDGKHVWALDRLGQIFYRMGITTENPLGLSWFQLQGNLKGIAITPDNVVWGINGVDDVFTLVNSTDSNPAGTGWIILSDLSKLAYVASDADGNVTGITLDGKKVRRVGITPTLVQGTSWQVID